MNFARVFTATAACVVLGAGAAACSGSFGSGSGLPNTLATPSFGQSSPTPPPLESSVILTYGESTAFQSLPEVGGYGGAIAFPKAPDPTAAPAAKTAKKDATAAPAPTPVSIAIGAKLSIVKPQDGPDLNFESGRGKRKKTREHPARALAFITLLPTHDVTLENYPRITLDIPREVASQYRDGEFGLALWNSGEKDQRYRLAVAELDTVATPPPARVVTTPVPPAKPVAAGAPSPTPSASASPLSRVIGPAGALGGLGSPPPGGAVPSAAPTLPPQRILFASTASTLKLVANRPAVFALYALPHPSASAAPSASPHAAATSAAGAPAATGPAATGPAATTTPATPTPAPSTSPTISPATGKTP